MKKLRFFTTIILIAFLNNSNAQNSFELTVSSEITSYLYHTFELNDDFISVGYKQSDLIYEGSGLLINRINQGGEITDEFSYYKQDTSFGLSFGFVKPDGNLYFAGLLDDSVNGWRYNVSYLCELNQEFEIVWEKMYEIPFPTHHSWHTIDNYLITSDNEIIVEGTIDTSLYGYDDILYLAKYNLEGNQLIFKPFMDWKDVVNGSDLIFNPDSTGFYLFGGLSYGSMGYTKNWIEFDMEFNVIDHGLIEDGLCAIRAPLTVKRLANGNIIMANKGTLINPNQPHELEMRIMDQELNLLKDTVLLHDEYVNTPDHRGMGFIDENIIWVATYEMIPPNFMGTDVFRFFIFDANLNLKGMKVYGGDTRYWFFDLLATSDEGCLLTGIVPEYEGSDSFDSYMIKVMPTDIITHAEETPYENDMDVFVYPNPFGNELKTETMRTGLTLTLFDSMGRLVLKNQIGDVPYTVVSTGKLLPGLYYYQVSDKSVIIQSGKLLKEKN
jgi:hypothetical protein